MSEGALKSRRSIWRALFREVSDFHPKLLALDLAEAALPRSARSARSRVLELAGVRMGYGTRVRGLPTIIGGPGLLGRLRLGSYVDIDIGCVFDVEESITLGNRVTLGPGVMILTSAHELPRSRLGPAKAAASAPVVIGAGTWLCARALILPGVSVGEGAIVEAGAVVTRNVAAHTRVGGIPAAPLERLSTNRA